ncbi:MAG: hypothetical protein CL607_04575 [Anaerolineaceae bacterium]|nr:hypothetical protein [Anaerolineaceae bacterium]
MNDDLNLSQYSTSALLRMHGALLSELRSRGVLRSENNPTGDYAEYLFSRAFGWTLETNSRSGYDAIDSDGIRYQIKGRRLAQRRSRQLSFIRNLDLKPFDFLAGVIFDADFSVIRAALVPVDVVKEQSRFVEHVRGWQLFLKDSIWDVPGVIDVTDDLKRAEKAL